jgi:O-acetyl-ADP-ribose deacetylase (regulator of RNase III)
MHVWIGPARIELAQGDVTLEEVDAIVNAANAALAGGGGVDGAIHRRGGPSIMEETRVRYPEGCPTGSAVITGGGQLAARYVIHAVGPVWRGGSTDEPELLAGAYSASMGLAARHDCRSIAFPSLSTGAYGYPIDLASEIALQTIAACLRQTPQPALVRCILFDARAMEVYANFMGRMEGGV